MDALANPDNVNHLIISLLEETNPVAFESPKTESLPCVSVLNNFTEDFQSKAKEMVNKSNGYVLIFFFNFFPAFSLSCTLVFHQF